MNSLDEIKHQIEQAAPKSPILKIIEESHNAKELEEKLAKLTIWEDLSFELQDLIWALQMFTVMVPYTPFKLASFDELSDKFAGHPKGSLNRLVMLINTDDDTNAKTGLIPHIDKPFGACFDSINIAIYELHPEMNYEQAREYSRQILNYIAENTEIIMKATEIVEKEGTRLTIPLLDRYKLSPIAQELLQKIFRE